MVQVAVKRKKIPPVLFLKQDMVFFTLLVVNNWASPKGGRICHIFSEILITFLEVNNRASVESFCPFPTGIHRRVNKHYEQLVDVKPATWK